MLFRDCRNGTTAHGSHFLQGEQIKQQIYSMQHSFPASTLGMTRALQLPTFSDTDPLRVAIVQLRYPRTDCRDKYLKKARLLHFPVAQRCILDIERHTSLKYDAIYIDQYIESPDDEVFCNPSRPLNTPLHASIIYLLGAIC